MILLLMLWPLKFVIHKLIFQKLYSKVWLNLFCLSSIPMSATLHQMLLQKR